MVHNRRDFSEVIEKYKDKRGVDEKEEAEQGRKKIKVRPKGASNKRQAEGDKDTAPKQQESIGVVSNQAHQAQPQVSLEAKLKAEILTQSSIKKQPKLEESHKRFTNYLDHRLFVMVQHLRKQGEIKSMTALLDKAVLEYLMKHHAEWLQKL